MVLATRNWIIRQLSLGEFASRGDVVRHAFWMSLKIAALAYGLNLVAHFNLYAFDLLPYDLFPSLIIATVLTPPVSFVVAMAAYSVVGFAVYDLALSSQELSRLSRTDPLSGLLNRRAFLDAFETRSKDVVLVLFDIDRFKTINDTYGHLAGDDAIIAVGRAIKTSFGPEAVSARIGGEEFAVLCADDSHEALLQRVEAARHAVSECRIVSGTQQFRVTVSAGMANPAGLRGFAEVFTEADRALYRAKADGRDRVASFLDLDMTLVSEPPQQAGQITETTPFRKYA
ncbi:GGDEF domain-containing protein [Rhizobium sp. CG5]|uniref:GGDEF domain-containing protein n=1 Tax=Rhizobium sp. CG5 TaxID=2726076 RepID=UPI002033E487|nr:GGDEF domain-containing protein [Rhizobium sp. CG5]MCM2472000.1 GGDEF domain-containing protein [Rhizobium sp. CG5]